MRTTASRFPLTPGHWSMALLAVLTPCLVAFHTPPSMTFFNQVMAVIGWGLWLASLGLQPAAWREADTDALAWRGLMGLAVVLGGYGLMSLGAVWWGPLPVGLGLMHAGLCAAAWIVCVAGWQLRRQALWDVAVDLFLWGLVVAGLIGWLIALLQAFHPSWTDGHLIAEATMPGRAVGNLRQPNHFSTQMVWSAAAAAALGIRRRLPAHVASVLLAVFIWAVVLSASRTGMIGMVFFCLWGLLHRGAPRAVRLGLILAPLTYGVWWGVTYGLAHLTTDVTFAAEARLHDGSDISSSRFKIWANVFELIRQHPWTGVGVGEFNVAWSFSAFPTRPLAFFDHTHNVLLQWAVELGLPLTLLLTAASGLALWPLLRTWWTARGARAADADHDTLAVLGMAGVIVAIGCLHSMLEYPLWYGHLLLPTAFAWGLGLAAADRLRRPVNPDSMDALPATVPLPLGGPRSAVGWAAAGMAVMGLWCTLDYLAAADIYAPHPGAGSLEDRIALSKRMPWWGYQADYAEVTVIDDDEPAPPPKLFARTLHNLVDSRLMMAYARSLAEHGELDKARDVVARLREFRNPASKAFLAGCTPDPAKPHKVLKPFDCSPPARTYSWQELLPAR